MRRQEPKSKSKPEPRVVELNINDLRTLAARAKVEQWERGDGEVVELVITSYCELLDLLEKKETTLARLRRMLFGASTEKTKDVLPDDPDPNPDLDSDLPADPDPAPDPHTDPTRGQNDEERDSTEDEPPAPKGHGRHSAAAYSGAERISISHKSLEPGDPCPACGDGKVYDTGRPGVLIRLVGQAPLQATVYQLQKLRCNLCGQLFTPKHRTASASRSTTPAPAA